MTDSLAGTAPRTNPPATNPAGLVAVVLAAGAGTRLRPLTLRCPKPLCPVGNVALLDHALDRSRPVTDAVAVNVHHGRELLERHLAEVPDVHVSIEADQALGTAGALGQLHGWIAGRDVVVVNADTWCEADLRPFVEGWDRERSRVVVAGEATFGPRARVVASLLPWSAVRELEPRPAELYEATWRPGAVDGTLDVVGYDGAVFDCGTPATYLAANLEVAERAGGSIVGVGSSVPGDITASVVGAGCVVDGRITSTVVWDGAEVPAVDVLDRAIRVSSTMTVLVR